MLKFFQRIGLALVLALGLLACRQNPEQPTEPKIDLQDPAPDSSANRSSEEGDKQLSGFAGIRFDQSLEDIRRSRPGALIREDYYIVGEGERLPSAVVNPNTDSSLTVLFESEERQSVSRIVITDGSNLEVAGIRIADSLEDVERLNGRPFLMSGLEWDYPGRVADWQGGKLPENLLVVLSSSSADSAPKDVTGDGLFSSRLEAWKSLNMRVVEIQLQNFER